MTSQTSRPDRVIGVFPILLAADGVAVERTVSRRAWRVAFPAATAAAGLAMAPVIVPLMPPPAVAAYTAAIGLSYQAEQGKTSTIAQPLADRTGWHSFIDDVERVYGSLPARDQQQAIIYAPSYGHAGALELWGPARGLPQVISGQNTYWHWSAGHTNTEVLIAVDSNPEQLRGLFRDVWQVGWVDCEYCMSWRNHMPIFAARGSKVPMESIWARARHYE